MPKDTPTASPSIDEATKHNQQVLAQLKTSASKVPAVFNTKPSTEIWKDYELVREIPSKFNWRGKTYIAEQLTELELENLTKTGFKSIVKKKTS